MLDLRSWGQASAKIAGICFLRDAVDLVPFLCGHYLRVGFDHLHFVDDGSTDGTHELLSQFAARTDRVSVRKVIKDSDQQSELMSAAANTMILDGYQVVVPFDADEFWHFTAETTCSLPLGRIRVGVVRALAEFRPAP